ncbi:hypothetical protein TSUD_383390 [Trifolium subterraneum]|uniref:Uncharacterized protein n=1 Tax=Trifolium subterraneum TaxID=3900 RepID=A0A2Z6PFA7_TRISU|nr:hypothetical protein TSUD_383390 [Trifolium subterraneum]
MSKVVNQIVANQDANHVLADGHYQGANHVFAGGNQIVADGVNQGDNHVLAVVNQIEANGPDQGVNHVLVDGHYHVCLIDVYMVSGVVERVGLHVGGRLLGWIDHMGSLTVISVTMSVRIGYYANAFVAMVVPLHMGSTMSAQSFFAGDVVEGAVRVLFCMGEEISDSMARSIAPLFATVSFREIVALLMILIVSSGTLSQYMSDGHYVPFVVVTDFFWRYYL